MISRILYDALRLTLSTLVLLPHNDPLALGINHKTAPVALRERVTFSPDTLDQALESLLAQPMVQGGVVLSTCNRTELYLSVEDQDNLHDAIIRWLAVVAIALATINMFGGFAVTRRMLEMFRK